MSGLVAFGPGAPPGPVPPVEEVGNKAWHLIQLAAAGLPVPPGFVVGTRHCAATLATGRLAPELRADILAQVTQLEQRTGQGFGSRRRPLLVSVRSGAAQSMPGMMDTLCDVGLTPEQEPAFLRATGNAHLFWDSLRRLVAAFAVVVRGAPAAPFEALLQAALLEAGVPHEAELDVHQLRRLATRSLQAFEAATGGPFPADPAGQLLEAIEAVFRSWHSPRAQQYRRLHGLDDRAGTAVTVQAMVFGNRGGTSGSGVGFTRDPATGAPGLYLDFLTGAQGEDLVSGRRTAAGATELAQLFPSVHAELAGLARTLEALFGDVQDFEFTVEQGKLYLLQSRAAKRTRLALLRSTLDLAREGIIPRAEARARLAGLAADELVLETVRGAHGLHRLATGIPASPGVVSGPLALDSARAVELAEAGQAPVLVRPDTSTADLAGMAVARGILTAEGSRTSHAALVARQLGVVAVVGCGAVAVDLERRCCRVGPALLHEGDILSLDGSAGDVYAGPVTVVRERPEALLAELAELRTA